MLDSRVENKGGKEDWGKRFLVTPGLLCFPDDDAGCLPLLSSQELFIQKTFHYLNCRGAAVGAPTGFYKNSHEMPFIFVETYVPLRLGSEGTCKGR